MRRYRLHRRLTMALILYALPNPAFLHADSPERQAVAAPVPGDRWMEIDLYWFDPNKSEGQISFDFPSASSLLVESGDR